MEESNVQVTENQEQNVSTPENQQNNETSKKATHKDLYNTNEEYKKSFDYEVQQAAKKAAVSLAEKKAAELEAEMTRAQELSKKSLEEQNKMLKEQIEQVKKQAVRDKEIESLKEQTAGLLAENDIPADFIGVFDFANATVDDIQAKVKTLSLYEYHQKGDFDKSVKAKLDDLLKQKPPETRVDNGGQKPPGIPQIF